MQHFSPSPALTTRELVNSNQLGAWCKIFLPKKQAYKELIINPVTKEP